MSCACIACKLDVMGERARTCAYRFSVFERVCPWA